MRPVPLRAVTLTLLLAGCDAAQPQAATRTSATVSNPTPDRGATTQPASPLRPDDFAVLDASLTHFAADPQVPTFPGLANKSTVVLHRLTAGASGFLSTDQLHGEFHDDPSRRPPADALADLQARNNGVPPTSFDRRVPATDRTPAAVPNKSANHRPGPGVLHAGSRRRLAGTIGGTGDPRLLRIRRIEVSRDNR